MLTTVEATYENGQIVWQEQPPVTQRMKVLVTFVEEKPAPIQDGIVRIGSLKDKLIVPEDFNAPLDDLNEYMY